MYTLTGEAPLKFSMLYTKDGNDSLKRVLKQRIGDSDLDDTTAFSHRSCELPTTQFVGGDRYLTRDYIDGFVGDSPVDMLADDNEVRLALCSLTPRD
jgi:hypothetical protein